MICPDCGGKLKEIAVADVTVHACEGGCGGIWFDQFVIHKVTGSDPAERVRLLNMPRDESVTVDEAQKHSCPKCEGVIMLKHFFGIKQEVEIDECPKCAGLWLDNGKFDRIQAQFGSDEERQQAEKEYFGNIRKQLDTMHKKPKNAK